MDGLYIGTLPNKEPQNPCNQCIKQRQGDECNNWDKCGKYILYCGKKEMYQYFAAMKPVVAEDIREAMLDFKEGTNRVADWFDSSKLSDYIVDKLTRVV